MQIIKYPACQPIDRIEAVIMPRVKIGDGGIIAAKSVVTNNVPAYSIVGGNPAKIIKQRFSEEIVKELLEIAWWDWDIAKISRNLDKIVAVDIDALRNCQ